MAKRQPKPEPFTLEELEDIARSPALQGFDQVLRLPVLVPASTVEAGSTSTVESRPATIPPNSSPMRSRQTATVEPKKADDTHTVEARLSSTVEADATRISKYWIAVGADGLFPASRVQRIGRAQDVMTHVEEAVYDALWGPKKREGQELYRLTRMGYFDLANKARVSKRSIQSVIERLVAKHIIEIETEADIKTRTPTEYRVYSYFAILKRIAAKGYDRFLHTGHGIFYAVPASTVELCLTSTVVDRTPSTVEASAVSTVSATAPSTVETTSTTSLDNKDLGITTPATVAPEVLSQVADTVLPMMAVDDELLTAMIIDCQGRETAATGEEIAYATEQWLRSNGRNPKIKNLAMLMRTAVPKFFPGEMIRKYRRQKQEQAERTRELAQSLLADPNCNDSDREWAKRVLAIDGRI